MRRQLQESGSAVGLSAEAREADGEASSSGLPATVEVKEITLALVSCPDPIRKDRKKLEDLLDRFIAENEDPAKSPNFRTKRRDEFQQLLRLLRDPALKESDDLLLKMLKLFKILSRKMENRIAFGAEGIQAVVYWLQITINYRIAAEGANVILNMCYEKQNVELVLANGGLPPLATFLESPDFDLQANAAGAIQSICYQEAGRRSVRDTGAIPSMLNLLASPHTKVVTRAVGALHNVSSDPESIRIIRRKDGIAPLVELLRAPQPAICGSAAGAIQNISRARWRGGRGGAGPGLRCGAQEVASREIIKGSGAVDLLADLLVGSDIQAQVCAAGALLNILGPELGPEKEENPQRRGFKRLLSLSLVLSMAYHSIYSDTPDPLY